MKYDCLILGSGPAGLYSALSCVKRGYSTALVERKIWGGTGFSTGCLPVKKMLRDIRRYEEAGKLVPSGSLPERFLPDGVLSGIRNYTADAERFVKNRLKSGGVDIFYGDGRFSGPRGFVIDGTEITAGSIVVATGTSASSPPDIPIDGDIVISHREAVSLDKIPGKLAVIGGNVEGMEFASLFSSLGSEVTVIEQENSVLPDSDMDLAAPVAAELEKKNVRLMTGRKVTGFLVSGAGEKVSLDNGSTLDFDKILVTGFRKLNLPRGIDKTGVIFEDGRIPVDGFLRTNIPHIYAAGDANGILGMAHAAVQQGMMIAGSVAGIEPSHDYRILPRAMFTIPEVAGAGFQERELKEKNVKYNVSVFELKDTWRGFSMNINSGFVKTIFYEDGRLAGIWMTGDNASEILSASGLLISKKVTREDILSNLFIHPTLGEGILEAAFDSL